MWCPFRLDKKLGAHMTLTRGRCFFLCNKFLCPSQLFTGFSASQLSRISKCSLCFVKMLWRRSEKCACMSKKAFWDPLLTVLHDPLENVIFAHFLSTFSSVQKEKCHFWPCFWAIFDTRFLAPGRPSEDFCDRDHMGCTQFLTKLWYDLVKPKRKS